MRLLTASLISQLTHASCCAASASSDALYGAPGIAPAGVWGSPPTSEPSRGGSLDENQLQAQAWVPQTMAELLKQAQLVVACALDDGRVDDGDPHGRYTRPLTASVLLAVPTGPTTKPS